MSQALWYYATNGQQSPSPVPFNALQQMAANGQLQPTDLVWSDGMPQWVAASTVQGVFAQPPTAAHLQAFPHMVQAQPAVLGYMTPNLNTPVYAGFWLRFCAAFVDGIILRVIGYGIGAVVGAASVGPNNGQQPNTGVALAAVLIEVTIAWLYGALQESSGAQATLGKRAVGLVVTDEAGQRITFARATGRHFGKYISFLILMIGYIMAGFTEKKQALHDMMAGTLVTKKVTPTPWK